MALLTATYPPTAACWPLLAQAVRTWRNQCQSGLSEPAHTFDFSSLWLVLPEHGYAQALRQALFAELGQACIAPRCFTLATLAEDIGAAFAPSPIAHTERLLLVYSVLRDTPFLQRLYAPIAAGAQVIESEPISSTNNLWTLAHQLLQLCDELSEQLADAVDTNLFQSGALEALLQRVFGARANLLSVEARILLNVWQALRDPRNPSAVLQERLQGVAGQASECGCHSFWYLQGEPLPAWQHAWLNHLAEELPVTLWSPQLRMAQTPAALVCAWPEYFSHEDASLVDLVPGQRVQQFGTLAADTPLPWQILACQSLEEEALSATRQVLAELEQALVMPLRTRRRTLALVAQDVVVARRTQALLARVGVTLQDESGWKLSTTAAATVLMCWLETVLQDAPWLSLLDLIKSPFVTLGSAAQQAALVQVADNSWRAAQVQRGWAALYQALPESATWARQTLLKFSDQARWLHRRGTLHSHLQRLLRSLQELGLAQNLQADAVGKQLWQVLQDTLLSVSQADEVSPILSLAEFQAWLIQLLESQAYLPARPNPSSDLPLQIVLVSLAGARLRHWDKVIILGGGAQVLQASVHETLFFGESVRRELGLPTRAHRQQQLEQDLLWLLSAGQPTTITWRTQAGGEPLALAPLLARLQLVTSLMAVVTPTPIARPAELVQPYAPLWQSCRVAEVAAHPTVVPLVALLPRALSAQAWQNLVTCPYRFWVHAAWRLGERTGMQDSTSKRDYGAIVHEILHTAHTALVTTEGTQSQPMEELAQTLHSIAAQRFAALGEQSPDAFIWQQRFSNWLPHYLTWWEAEYAAGWRWQAGEIEQQRSLTLPNGDSLMLRGRLDRVDHHPRTPAWRILDYKTAHVHTLRDKALRVGEDVQLLFYGLLYSAACAQTPDSPNEIVPEMALNAAYLPADQVEKKIMLYQYTASATDFATLLRAETQRLQTVWSLLQQGQPLPAQGTPRDCAYCAARGLCRRDWWDNNLELPPIDGHFNVLEKNEKRV